MGTQSRPKEVSCVFWEAEHLFQSVGCASNKHQFLIAPSTESEIVSLDAGLRVDGLLALDLWDIVIEELRTTKDNIQPGHTRSGKFQKTQPNHSSLGKLKYVQHNSTICDSRNKTKRVNRKQGIDQLNEVDRVPTKTRSSQGESQLYIFEGNEAAIKMIIFGGSPTLGHVSRTHRVALDWLFDRVNLDPKIQIKYVDTKNQLAGILTKVSFSTNEWNQLLCLFNIMCSSTYSWVSDDKSPTYQSGVARPAQRGCLVTRIGMSSQSGE